MDTMALVLWLEERQLPVRVSRLFERALEKEDRVIIWIPAIVLAEIGYLSEKGRIEVSLLEVNYMVSSSSGTIQILTLDYPSVQRAFEITDIPELHDRLIAGAGFLKSCPVLTNDPKMEKSAFIQTIWK